MEQTQIPLFLLVPFVLMLLCIALAPLFFEHRWEKNLNKLIISVILSVPVVAWMVGHGLSDALVHQMVYDYLPFIILLLALFVVTGGIRVKGDIRATPAVNTIFLAIGWLLASFMGTTGAAMLLIRPLIATNLRRQHNTHTILFFIAAVANCGGLLTPLGDPPLFLLYLRGAEFGWFFHLLPMWLTVGALLLATYFVLDCYYYNKEKKAGLAAPAEPQGPREPLAFAGLINVVWLLCVMACVMFITPGFIPAMGDHHAPWYLRLLREFVLLLIIGASWLTTKRQVRTENKFSWRPIIEVAVLFLGIFATMTPALMYLNANAPRLGLTTPEEYFFSTGILSSFLDNAPTAVAFHTVAGGMGLPAETVVAGIPELILKAIACGAVFFGALTYIGNGPNFMVKAIAEQSGIRMPSFFGYITRFSFIFLLPIYIIVWLLFFF